MAVEYDLIIIGNTLAAREGAAIAAREGARVALMASPDQVEVEQQSRLFQTMLTQALSGDAWGQPKPTWADLRQQARLAADFDHASLALEVLARQVDVVTETAQFSPKPRLSITTEHRTLRARAYVLACGGETVVPAIPGLGDTPFRTPDTLMTLEVLPQRLAILGRTPEAIGLAQAFARLGTAVTLISRGDTLLPTEDPAVAEFATALLLAEGVHLRLQAQIERIEGDSGKATLYLSDPLEPVDCLLVATGYQPAVAGLNLERVGVKADRSGLAVDEGLRTTCDRIFACGAELKSHRNPSLERYEVQLAVHNALYLPRRRVDHRTVPYLLPTLPQVGRVGLTEPQARHWYGDKVETYSVPTATSVKAHLRGDPSGFCKLIAHANGQLLGAHIAHDQADEQVQALAIMMQQGIHLAQIAQLPALPHTLTELLIQAADQWRQQRWQPGQWRRDWAENWFNWRRSST